jgi:hypothetical protein
MQKIRELIAYKSDYELFSSIKIDYIIMPSIFLRKYLVNNQLTHRLPKNYQS